MFEVRLSPSKLSLLECPRCFYDANHSKFERPRGIFPSLPGGMDLVVKAYADRFRVTGKLPPELEGQVPVGSTLYGDTVKLQLWRHWRTGLTCQVEIPEERIEGKPLVEGGEATPPVFYPAALVTLIGAIDDLLVTPSTQGMLHNPFDTKTKGSEPKDSGTKYYQTQLDCYELMLQEEGLPTSGKGYLWYFWPESIEPEADAVKALIPNKGLPIRFHTKVYALDVSADRAKAKIKEAVRLLMGPRPAHGPACEWCQYGKEYATREQAAERAAMKMPEPVGTPVVLG